jgi:hypothetical protein
MWADFQGKWEMTTRNPSQYHRNAAVRVLDAHAGVGRNGISQPGGRRQPEDSGAEVVDNIQRLATAA